nr:Maf family protein [Maliibacterium massiliense]
MARLVLASASPRRVQMLRGRGYAFRTLACPLPERCDAGLACDALVCALAEQKARYALARVEAGCVVLGADTAVCLEGAALGKPKDAQDAMRMLALLSGRTHTVYTGVCILQRGAPAHIFACGTRVTFRALSQGEIARYVAGGEPMDKAGAYSIQGGAGAFVSRIEGDFDTVVGLPMDKVAHALAAMGVVPQPIEIRGDERDV